MSDLIGQDLDELHGPVSSRVAPGLLEIAAGEHTDLFCPPDGGAGSLGAPGLLAPAPTGDYTLSAHVAADLRATFDAGALILWQDERTWAKLAIELSPAGRPTIVSVVTRARSDDCNSITLEEPQARIRLARIGDTFAFHVHLGDAWQLIRHFWLGDGDGDGPVRPGFLAQSPTGGGCTARFRDVVFEPRRLGDVRDGT